MTSRYRRPINRIKVNIYLADSMREVTSEAARLSRSVNWVVEQCVLIGIAKVRELPDADEQGAA